MGRFLSGLTNLTLGLDLGVDLDFRGADVNERRVFFFFLPCFFPEKIGKQKKAFFTPQKNTHTWHLFFSLLKGHLLLLLLLFKLPKTSRCRCATSTKIFQLTIWTYCNTSKNHLCKTQTACKTRTSHHLDQRVTYKAGWDCRDLGGVSQKVCKIVKTSHQWPPLEVLGLKHYWRIHI